MSPAAFELGILPEWDLRDLYAAMDAPEVSADLSGVETRARQFAETWKGRLNDAARDDPAALHAAIRAFEEIQESMGRLGSYAGLVFAGDNSDPKRAKFYGDVQEKLTAAGTHLIFFTLELNRIEDSTLEAALSSDSGLARYRPWIADVRKGRPYDLEDRVEELFHEKSLTTYEAWSRLFDETVAALRFDVDGRTLALEPTLNLLQSPDEAKRRGAAEALAKVFKENVRLFALIMNTLVKDKEISDRWRGFKDPADSRHLSNDVEPEVVEALAAAVRAAHPRLSHRYYALKARWFGKDKLDYWDRNAPLPAAPEQRATWDDAQKTILSAYGAFSPDMAEIAGRFFERNWIDAPIRPGKTSGAFASGTVPSVHPYVLVNYDGLPRDVMVLAHELGHGVHQVLAAPNGLLMASTPLTLAETASVFGEMLTFRAVLAKTSDPRARKSLIAHKVEDMLNTVVRQIAFHSFEKKVHAERRSGELEPERLCEIWMEVQSESLGPSVRLGPGYETFWTYISHFVQSPFYVYAYAFGDCLVNSLYAVYEKAETGFAEKYFDLLRAGGTKHHSELLAPFGLNARDPAFWDMGLSLIDRMIGELEGME